MAEVFSSNSPCMLGKRVLSPHAHGTMMAGQLDFSSKKRRLGQGADQGRLVRTPPSSVISLTAWYPHPLRTPGKRARPLSPLQPSSHFPAGGGDASRGFSAGSPTRRPHHADGVKRSVNGDAARECANAEVGALRAHSAEKEGALNMAQEENGRLKEGLGMYQKELERLSAENRILKRAVGIQNTKGKELEGQLHGLQQTAGQAAEYVKRLEQTNYALSVRVQAMGNSGPSDFMGGQRPPDVF
ncbi:unnamed protein product [Scytosiphon promiscuus]